MVDVRSALASTALDAVPPLRITLYRFFFYGWLFRDADSGSSLERAIALRHNRQQAKWLPTYLWRWLVTGLFVAAMSEMAERLVGDPILSAVLALMLVFVIMFLLLTSIFWAVLRRGGPTA